MTPAMISCGAVPFFTARSKAFCAASFAFFSGYCAQNFSNALPAFSESAPAPRDSLSTCPSLSIGLISIGTDAESNVFGHNLNFRVDLTEDVTDGRNILGRCVPFVFASALRAADVVVAPYLAADLERLGLATFLVDAESACRVHHPGGGRSFEAERLGV